ncbi:MAG: HD domain-containing protein [Desulfobacteraceae bacterium]|nr:HD domain-containing protein [Desulfobacteraceae bacterium]
MVTLQEIKNDLNERQARMLSPYAAKSSHAVRKKPETSLKSGYRQAFSLDADRIMHSMAYTRYSDKTQVFYLIRNDHITHRVLHVQLVSKIARTIGRFLGLNEDLIEAAALGHDIGHTPFGHDGERFLSKLCRQAGIGYFLHNVQSIQFLDRVERKGRGWNLSLQSLDGIVCHDGEIHNRVLAPVKEKNFESLNQELKRKKEKPDYALMPMSMEGCVVRMADTVAYIGRDLEDAIRLELISRSDIPPDVRQVLGDTNGTIVYNLVTDIICNSYRRPYVAFSEKVSHALKKLKDFNLQFIYLNERFKRHTGAIEILFGILFEQYLEDLESQNHSSKIFSGFLSDMSQEYICEHRPAEIVRDFIAGMTDRYFLQQCPEKMRPQVIDY